MHRKRERERETQDRERERKSNRQLEVFYANGDHCSSIEAINAKVG